MNASVCMCELCVYMKERERESSLIGIVWVARAQCQQQPQWFPTSLQRHHRKGGGTFSLGSLSMVGLVGIVHTLNLVASARWLGPFIGQSRAGPWGQRAGLFSSFTLLTLLLFPAINML